MLEQQPLWQLTFVGWADILAPCVTLTTKLSARDENFWNGWRVDEKLNPYPLTRGREAGDEYTSDIRVSKCMYWYGSVRVQVCNKRMEDPYSGTDPFTKLRTKLSNNPDVQTERLSLFRLFATQTRKSAALVPHPHLFISRSPAPGAWRHRLCAAMWRRTGCTGCIA